MTRRSTGARTYAPLRRVLALLAFLTDAHRANARRVFTTDELLAALSQEYGSGSTAERTLRGDLQALRTRGLVETNLPHPEHTRRRGVRRTPPQHKVPELRLTRGEHAVLQEMRRLLGRPFPRVPPTAVPATEQGRANARVEDALLLVRLLEEAQDDVPVSALATALGVGRQQVTAWIAELADVFDDSRAGGSSVDVTPDWDDIEAVAMLPTARTLAGMGADLLGLLPYSAAEAQERLDLIAEFRASPHTAVLPPIAWQEVEQKLRGWLLTLERRGVSPERRGISEAQ